MRFDTKYIIVIAGNKEEFEMKIYKNKEAKCNNYPKIKFITILSYENGDLSFEGSNFIILLIKKDILIIIEKLRIIF